MVRRKSGSTGAAGVSAKGGPNAWAAARVVSNELPQNLPVRVDAGPSPLRTWGPPRPVASGVAHDFRVDFQGAVYARNGVFFPPGSSKTVTLLRVGGAMHPFAAPQDEPVVEPLQISELRSSSEAAAPLAVASGVRPQAQTVIYIHGIANKPAPSVLKCQWDMALFGAQLGDRSRMAYWVDRTRYPIPLSTTCTASDSAILPSKAGLAVATTFTPQGSGPEEEAEFLATLVADSGEEASGPLTAIGRRMLQRTMSDEGDDSPPVWTESLDSPPPIDKWTHESARLAREHKRRIDRYNARVLPLPGFARRLITRTLTAAFLEDVADFFYDEQGRAAMTRSLAERLNSGGGPFAIVAHSQGTMIAFEVLRRLRKADCRVSLFLTIGSPLGMKEVQDVFAGWGAELRVPDCVDRWVNIADKTDPVAFDSDISNDFDANDAGVGIENHAAWGLNEDALTDPHSATGYLRSPEAQAAMRQTVSNAFPQAVGRSIVTRDLADQMEDSEADAPHKTLIQLVAAEGGAPRAELSQVRDNVVRHIDKLVAARPPGLPVSANVEPLKHYVAAELTRGEIESLRTLFADLAIERIWRNARKSALIHYSAETVQARAAQRSYQATGRDVCWAVLDTGVAAGHPHFRKFANIRRQWDCTLPGAPVEVDSAGLAGEFDRVDGHGHGTHVAAIVAGLSSFTVNGRTDEFAGMAPEAQIFGLKVLDDEGNGNDSDIIKALDLIYDLNESAGRLVVHGVNLSLGGNFDPSVYGCGHTPLCQELRRLWRQGVLVCLAAGNEGYAILTTTDGDRPTNLDLSIGDPANLDEAIAVGSIHKRNPYSYGISYFSSRGPTADGRVKPDVVAPGERILSAAHNYPRSPVAAVTPGLDQFFVEMSGTSMAAPHVSGLLAGFLSVRREFIGYPEKVKEILLANCSDLRRDRHMQGAGLPNLAKMLINT